MCLAAVVCSSFLVSLGILDCPKGPLGAGQVALRGGTRVGRGRALGMATPLVKEPDRPAGTMDSRLVGEKLLSMRMVLRWTWY